MYSIFLDLPNVLLILLFVILCCHVKLIPGWLAISLCFFAFSPFFVNDLLFPASFMPDQYRYVNLVQQLRSLDFNYEESGTVEWAGWIFAAMPLPFTETIRSLGFFNRFAISIFIIWLYASKAIRGLPLAVLIFYPSLVLYSSLSLRDILILILMITTIILYIDGEKFYSLAFACILVFLKIQNFFLMLVFMIIHDAFKKNSFINKNKYLFFAVAVCFLTLFADSLIESLNNYRVAMYIEDGGHVDDILQIDTIKDVLFIGVPSAVYFLVKPLPWEAVNIFQLIQSLENIAVVFLLVYLFKHFCKRNPRVLLKWVLFFFTSLLVYGLVVSNFGTAARYRFPFVVLLVVGIFYEIKSLDGNFKIKAKQQNILPGQ